MPDTLDYSPTPSTLSRRLVTAIHFTALLSPCLPLIGLYGAWIVAWITLGHPPRPSLDDPKAVLGLAYDASALSLLFLPAGAAAGLCSVLLAVAADRPKKTKAFWTTAVAVLWTIALGLLVWDPLAVGYWWMD